MVWGFQRNSLTWCQQHTSEMVLLPTGAQQEMMAQPVCQLASRVPKHSTVHWAPRRSCEMEVFREQDSTLHTFSSFQCHIYTFPFGTSTRTHSVQKPRWGWPSGGHGFLPLMLSSCQSSFLWPSLAPVSSLAPNLLACLMPDSSLILDRALCSWSSFHILLLQWSCCPLHSCLATL